MAFDKKNRKVNMLSNKKATAERARKSMKTRAKSEERENGLKLMARLWLTRFAQELEPNPQLEAEAIAFYNALERFDQAIDESGNPPWIFAPVILAYYGEDYVADHVMDELKSLTLNRGLFRQDDLLQRAREEGRREALSATN